MTRLAALLRSLWWGLLHPSQLDDEMNDEMRFHIDMETQRLMEQRGLDRAEARRQASIAFGGVEKYRGAARDALRLTWARGLSTDLKLGTRMLGKYHGLTAIALLALSLAIGAGAAYLEFVNDLYRPVLPFANGDRLIGIQVRDLATGNLEERVAWDFASWRGTLRTVEDLGAFAAVDRNLITDDGRSELVKAVEISASAFRMLQVPPALGRPLIEQDEAENAPPAAVIGYDLWQSRFGADRNIVGRGVKLGISTYTIVGVMPHGFGFPIYQDVWVPLKINAAATVRRAGEPIKIFGVLSRGVRITEAQAELAARGTQAATGYADTHKQLAPRVLPYVSALWFAQSDGEIARAVLYSANIFFIALLAVCGANIATLVFARTATRANEINVRTALGASRLRIAGQLFTEALVMCSLAAGVGLLTAYYGSIWVKRTVFVAQGIRPMFWWNDQLSTETIVYAIVLAALGAVIIGVVPAWKATNSQLQDRLKQAHTVTSDLKFGGVWTAVIVTQVALTVVFLCIVGALAWGVLGGHGGVKQLAFSGDRYLSVRVGMDGDATADTALRNRFQATFDELARRLRNEPGIGAVTFASHPPGINTSEMHIQVDGIEAQAGRDGGPWIRTSRIDVDLPSALGVPIVAGRGFTAGDRSEDRHVAIVDETFVRTVLGGADAVGHQVRELPDDQSEPGPWLQIVGVVRDLATTPNKSSEDATLYQPLAAGGVFPLHVVVRFTGDISAGGSRVRAIAGAVDPSLRIDQVQTFAQLASADRIAMTFFVRIGTGIACVALMLSIAGVYALLSFTVARRTPEIAIRMALGADPRQVVLATFARALLQVMLGVLVGCLPAAAIVAGIEPSLIDGTQWSVALATCACVVAFMIAITAIACYGPARRALRIQPADALKA